MGLVRPQIERSGFLSLRQAALTYTNRRLILREQARAQNCVCGRGGQKWVQLEEARPKVKYRCSVRVRHVLGDTAGPLLLQLVNALVHFHKGNGRYTCC